MNPTRGVAVRGGFSGAVFLAWLIFIIAWLAFFSDIVYPWERNISIILLSLLLMILLIGGTWSVWVIKKIPKEGRDIAKMMGFRWRIWTSMFLPILALVFLIFYFWFFGEKFNVWQHIAVILITIILMAGILGGIWGHWSMKKKNSFDDFEKFGEDIEKSFEKEFEDDL